VPRVVYVQGHAIYTESHMQGINADGEIIEVKLAGSASHLMKHPLSELDWTCPPESSPW